MAPIAPNSSSERVSDCPALPRGWKRKEMLRKSGLASAKVEVCYLSPSGRVIANKGQLVRYLGDAWDLTNFDFQSGRMLSARLTINEETNGTGQSRVKSLEGRFTPQHSSHKFPITGGAGLPKTVGPKNLAQPQRMDHNMQAPIRQTASIFKQPITLVHTTARDTKRAPDNELKTQGLGKREKPRQVFWAKRLQGIRACMQDGEQDPLAIPLPAKMAAIGPDVDDYVAELSLAAAVQATVPGTPMTGQTGTRKSLESNPGVYVNPDQPLIQAVVISEQDVAAQERRVHDARRRLEEALKHFG